MATKKNTPAAAATTAPKRDKAEAFRKLANKRLAKAVSAIDALSRLGSPNYTRTQEQVDKIATVLTSAITRVKESLAPKSTVAAQINDFGL